MPSDLPDPQAWIIGEALVDVVRTSTGSSTRHAGGSPLNVAVGLARPGTPTVLSTQIGCDPDGDLIADHLLSSGATFSGDSRSGKRTSTAEANLDERGSATYRFAVDWSWEAPASPVAVSLARTGSLATFIAPGRDGVIETLSQLPASTFVSYDPNVRPDLLPNRAEAVAAFERVANLAHFVKLSDEDLEWLFYPGESVTDALLRIQELGPEGVAVTCGSSGTLVGTGRAVEHVPACTATVIDTVGAGDSWMSGFLHGVIGELHQGGAMRSTASGHLSMERLVAHTKFASRCAAVTVSRQGAQPPTRQEI